MAELKVKVKWKWYRRACTTTSATPVVEHWMEQETARWVYHEVSIRRPIAPWANALPLSYVLLPAQWVHPMKDWSDDPSHHEQTLYLWAMSRSQLNGSTPWRIDPTTHRTTSKRSTSELRPAPSSMGPPHEGLIRRPIAPRANALPLSYAPLPRVRKRRLTSVLRHSWPRSLSLSLWRLELAAACAAATLSSSMSTSSVTAFSTWLRRRKHIIPGKHRKHIIPGKHRKHIIPGKRRNNNVTQSKYLY